MRIWFPAAQAQRNLTTEENHMNQAEQREIAKIASYTPTLGLDFAARALGTIHRCAMTKKSKLEIEAVAKQMGVSII